VTASCIYLASASPRRSELLKQIGVAHEIRPVSLDETPRPAEDVIAYVSRLAEQKAQELSQKLSADDRRPVLAADTAVALGGEILGKPSGRADAVAMLRSLSGNTHLVHSAVAVMSGGDLSLRVCSSGVTFRRLGDAEIEWYWRTGEPRGKAGAYAIQGRAAAFISRIEGSYSGVMGLPLYETWELLSAVMRLDQGAAAV
jgi:septum formation protein